MGLFHLNKQRETSLKQTPRRGLPPDQSALTWGPEPCHCLSDAELKERYEILRAEEHARIDGKCGCSWSRSVGLAPPNKARNRYANVVPWDHSRVRLPVVPGANDYINGSWIQMGSKAYIATQGPLPSTISHFWQMVYAYGGEPSVVVMLTSLYERSVEKCSKYWPDTKDETMQWPASQGDFLFGLRVVLEKTVQNEQYNYSQLRLIPDDDRYPPHTVHHVYYHSWLDFTKPNMDADLRSLIHFINNKLKNPGAPPIVHCSAGIGRSGTFIALDSLLSKIDVDIDMSYAPINSPVWLDASASLMFQDTPFHGRQEPHVDIESITLSSVNVQNYSTPTSKRNGEAGAHINLANNLANGKINVPTTGQRPSALTAALNQSGQVNGQANGSLPPVDETKPMPDAPLNPAVPAVPAVPAEPSSGSAKTGPVLSPLGGTAELTKAFMAEQPDNLDVFEWFDPKRDPVMSSIKCMRAQRPKMVQGTQQLGYVYDQFEIGQQLTRSYGADYVPRRTRTEQFSSSVTSNGSVISNTYADEGTSPPHLRKNSVSSQGSFKGPKRSNTFSSISSFFSSSHSRQRQSSVSSNSQMKRQPSVRG